jgi:hypothetical protein
MLVGIREPRPARPSEANELAIHASPQPRLLGQVLCARALLQPLSEPIERSEAAVASLRAAVASATLTRVLTELPCDAPSNWPDTDSLATIRQNRSQIAGIGRRADRVG